MRVCFIGDSHLACIKKAWDADLRGRHAGLDVTFFAVPGRGMESLEVRDGTLGSEDAEVARILGVISGGAERIDGSFDVYALHGLHLGIITVLGRLREMRGTRDFPRPALVATPEFRAALHEEIESSISAAILRKLRQITQAPAVVSPTPMAEARFQPLRARLEEVETAQVLAGLFDETCGAVCAGLGARFVPQPPQTRSEDGLATKAEYSLGAARFSLRVEKTSKEDATHMNVEYGAEAGAALLAAIAGL